MTMTVTERSTVVAANGITSADLGGEAVLLDSNSGRYFGLNAVGARILELVVQPRSISSIVEQLEQEFDVTTDKLTSDVLSFVHQLVDRRLVEVVDNAPA